MTGTQGSQGATGATGERGTTGPQGVQGLTGADGATGAQACIQGSRESAPQGQGTPTRGVQFHRRQVQRRAGHRPGSTWADGRAGRARTPRHPRANRRTGDPRHPRTDRRTRRTGDSGPPRAYRRSRRTRDPGHSRADRHAGAQGVQGIQGVAGPDRRARHTGHPGDPGPSRANGSSRPPGADRGPFLQHRLGCGRRGRHQSAVHHLAAANTAGAFTLLNPVGQHAVQVNTAGIYYISYSVPVSTVGQAAIIIDPAGAPPAVVGTGREIARARRGHARRLDDRKPGCNHDRRRTELRHGGVYDLDGGAGRLLRRALLRRESGESDRLVVRCSAPPSSPGRQPSASTQSSVRPQRLLACAGESTETARRGAQRRRRAGRRRSRARPLPGRSRGRSKRSSSACAPGPIAASASSTNWP